MIFCLPGCYFYLFCLPGRYVYLGVMFTWLFCLPGCYVYLGVSSARAEYTLLDILFLKG